MTVGSVVIALVVVVVCIGLIRTYVRLYEKKDNTGALFVGIATVELLLITVMWLLGVDPNT